MSTYRVLGHKLVSETEFLRDRQRSRKRFSLEAGAPAFQPVGPGLPLTVEMRHLYTGRFPDTILNSANMLVTSSIKNLDQFDAAARAVNFLMPKQSSRHNYVSPPADQNGTPLVCYVPAVTAVSTTITFNLVFQRFDDSILSTIQSVFTGAASIPMFMSAAPYLLGAGTLLKLAADVGDAIFNGQPDFSPTTVLNFTDPTDPVQQSGLLVLFKNEEDTSTDPNSLTFENIPGHHGLIDPKTGKLYAGPAPYIVLSVDGTKQDSLKSFAPTAATAALLAKFFNVKDGGLVPTQDILDALKAFSDLKYRKAADELEKQIAAAPAEDKPALQKQLDALVKNILNPELKPS